MYRPKVAEVCGGVSCATAKTDMVSVAAAAGGKGLYKTRQVADQSEGSITHIITYNQIS